MKKQHGFTLIELLVVIAIIALLIAILIPVLGAAREQAFRILCSTHERNLGMSLMIYASNNNNILPMHPANQPGAIGNHFSTYTVGHYFATILLKNMGSEVSEYQQKYLKFQMLDVFYCPSNTFQKRHPEIFCSPDTEAKSKTNPLSWCYTIGYFTMVPDDEDITNKLARYQIYGKDGLPDPAKKFLQTTDVSYPAETELVLDFTIEYPRGSDKFDSQQSSPVTTSHLSSKAKPTGGNIGFVDGHVEWRRFPLMYRRYSQSRTQFWW